MKIEHSKEWWLGRAEAEEGVIGAGSPPNMLDDEMRILTRQMADKIEKLRAALEVTRGVIKFYADRGAIAGENASQALTIADDALA